MSQAPETIKDLIKIQRAFLHDIATPLMIAGGSLDFITDNLPDSDPKLVDRVQKTQKAVEKITALLRTHRKHIIDIETHVDAISS